MSAFFLFFCFFIVDDLLGRAELCDHHITHHHDLDTVSIPQSFIHEELA